MVSRERSVKDAIEFMKTCPYKATAVKVELEAQLNRDCDGSEYETCYECDGSGYTSCDDCCGDGVVTLDGEDLRCENCDGDGEFRCGNCDGDGEVYSDSGDQSDDWCSEFLHGHVSKEARQHVIYSQFYNDGSVDSEFTFTVDINHPEAVIEYIQAFNALAKDIGGGLETSNAGMHIAILNEPNGNYPRGNTLDDTCTQNFKNAMAHFMPALFFLGSPDHQSRPLGFRMPIVSTSDKYSAINGNKNCFEYRVFETCYKKPEAFYDMFCTIAKTLQFYKPEPTILDFFNSVGELDFLNGGGGLHKIIYTEKHLEALKYGLRYLKPDHKTIKQLFTERAVPKTKQEFRKLLQKHRRRNMVEWTAMLEKKKKENEMILAADATWYDEAVLRLGGTLTRDYGSKEEYLARRKKELEKQVKRLPTLDGYIQQKQLRLTNNVVKVTV